jgi:hypothetical protein
MLVRHAVIASGGTSRILRFTWRGFRSVDGESYYSEMAIYADCRQSYVAASKDDVSPRNELSNNFVYTVNAAGKERKNDKSWEGADGDEQERHQGEGNEQNTLHSLSR